MFKYNPLQYKSVPLHHSFQVLKRFNIRIRLESVCVFPMLTHLDVGLLSVDILLALLQKTPVLETLVLKVSNY